MDELVGPLLKGIAMENEGKQRKLQEMLAAARGALEDALSFAKEHDLCFEFTGVRRGPEAEDPDGYGALSTNRWIDANDPKVRKDDEYGSLPVVVSELDVSYEWIGSQC